MKLNFLHGLGICLVLLCTAHTTGLHAASDDKVPPPVAQVTGVIKAVDLANQTFVLSLAGGSIREKPAAIVDELTITFDLKTSVSLDGKPTSMDKALIVGNTAAVMHLNGMALKVHVKSKPA